MNTSLSGHTRKAMGVALGAIWMFSVAPPRLRADTLQGLLQREWEYELHEDPQLATAVGDRRYNGMWNDYSISAVEEQKRDLSNWFSQFEQVDPKALDEEGRLNRDLMLRNLKQRLTSLRLKAYEMPINLHSGVHLQVVETISVTPFDNAADYARYVERLRGLPRVIENWITVLERGKTDRLVPFRPLVEESI
ncbi:MAG: DUF885 family protein, partial [Bryobacteraceae bacterium]